MNEAKIDSNPSFQRAKILLDTTITTPEHLITTWRLVGAHLRPYPRIERLHPWYQGLEKYL